MSSGKASGAGPASTVTNVMDVTNFLAKFLSGKQNVLVVPNGSRDTFATAEVEIQGKPYHEITLPDWRSYSLPVDGFEKWRIYREGNWHETCHIKNSPSELYKYGDNQVERFVMNVLEDYRVEQLEVKDWVGYLPEQIHAKAYAYAIRPELVNGDVPPPGGPATPSPSSEMPYFESLGPDHPLNKQARMEAFLQKFLVGQMKGKLPADDLKKVNEVTEEMQKKLTELNEENEKKHYSGSLLTAKMGALVEDTISKLGIAPVKPNGTSQGSSQEGEMGGEGSEGGEPNSNGADPNNPTPSDYDESFSGKAAEGKKGSKGKDELAKDMEDYYDKTAKGKDPKRVDGKTKPGEITKEDVETAKVGVANVTDEYAKISRGEAVDPSLIGWASVPTQAPAELYRDKKFIDAMKVALKHWKTGSKEILEKAAKTSVSPTTSALQRRLSSPG